MIVGHCQHEWGKHTNFKQSLGASMYLCKKCNTEMSAAEVFQLEALENQNETLKHIKGFQKYIAIVAVVISFVALIISLLK